MAGPTDSGKRTEACRACGRTARFHVDGDLRSWTCSNCGTSNVVESTERTRVPVVDGEDPPHGDDPSIH